MIDVTGLNDKAMVIIQVGTMQLRWPSLKRRLGTRLGNGHVLMSNTRIVINLAIISIMSSPFLCKPGDGVSSGHDKQWACKKVGADISLVLGISYNNSRYF